jgi:hypothetical protein
MAIQLSEIPERKSRRQAHQQPAAHIRGAGGKRGHKWPQTAAAENIIIKVFVERQAINPINTMPKI